MSMYGDAGVQDTDDVEGDGDDTGAAGEPSVVDELAVVPAELQDGRRTISGTMSSRSPPASLVIRRSSPASLNKPPSNRYGEQLGTACSSRKPASAVTLPPLSPLLSPAPAGTTAAEGGEVVVTGVLPWWWESVMAPVQAAGCSLGFLELEAVAAAGGGVVCCWRKWE